MAEAEWILGEPVSRDNTGAEWILGEPVAGQEPTDAVVGNPWNYYAQNE